LLPCTMRVRRRRRDRNRPWDFRGNMRV